MKMKAFKDRLPFFVFLVSLLLGGIFRFYKVDWGNGYPFHPDEYHIIGAVGRLINEGIFSNPKLFSYGSFTVYLIYIARWILVNIFNTVNPNLFIVGRTLSAFFSTLTLINIFLICKKIFPKNSLYPHIAILISAFLPGFIQQAHFLTPETFMTFWITLSVYFTLEYIERNKIFYLFPAAASIGIAGGTKISSFAPIPLLIIFVLFANLKKNGFFRNLERVTFYVMTAFIFFFAVFPYSILDYENFRGTTRYESSLSAGSIKVFYTRSFENSTPFLFQFTKIYPYTLGLSLTVFSVFGFFLSIYTIIKEKNKVRGHMLLLICGVFLSYFIFNCLLFTKWTRFVHPTIPFFVILTLNGIYEVTHYLKKDYIKEIILSGLLTILLVPTIIWGMMYFSIYTKDDVRTTATNWINKNIPKNNIILTETGNTIEVPLGGNYDMTPFDFYNLDTEPSLFPKFIEDIIKSDYFIIQSRRIYKNHNRFEFPLVYNFYNSLFSGKLGYEEIAVFDSYPSLQFGENEIKVPDDEAEETWTVFDHPVIKIFKKVKSYPENYYAKLLRP